MALHPSKWVIFDSRRMKKVPDSTVERELRKSAQTLRSMHRLLFVNRKPKWLTSSEHHVMYELQSARTVCNTPTSGALLFKTLDIGGQHFGAGASPSKAYAKSTPTMLGNHLGFCPLHSDG